jgi:hypothetical protein
MSNHDFTKQSRAVNLKNTVSREKDKNLLIEKRLVTLQRLRSKLQLMIKKQAEKSQIENLKKQINQM